MERRYNKARAASSEAASNEGIRMARQVGGGSAPPEEEEAGEGGGEGR